MMFPNLINFQKINFTQLGAKRISESSSENVFEKRGLVVDILHIV